MAVFDNVGNSLISNFTDDNNDVTPTIAGGKDS
jgi:hypothetical protein